MSGVVGTSKIAQVGFIVSNIEETKVKWAEFLGVEVPDTIGVGEYSITKTKYKGEDAPNANCKMAFFTVGDGVQLELIEPNESPSTWRDYLNEHGEGIHHLAFQVSDTKKIVLSCEQFGTPVVQTGQYGDASGQYTYLDGNKDLKCIVELLESYSS